ncbi:MAG TPA: TonB-dependent receptor [Puia sp.]
MSRKHFFLLLLSASGSTMTFAQTNRDTTIKPLDPFNENTFKPLDQVVVTATKYPVKEGITGKVLTVITKEQLEKSSGRQLTEVLNTQAGVVVVGSNNTLGSEQDVHMQGAEAGQTLILIDGIPAYDPSGTSTNFDLNLLNTDEIERVEILKGSQSTLYGSDAVAGVINIITKKGNGKPFNASVNLSAGSYGTWKTAAGFNGKLDSRTGYNVRYTHLQSDGISSAHDATAGGSGHFDNDGFKENLVLANITHQLTDALQLRANFQYNHYNNDIDGGAYLDDKLFTAKNKNTQAGVGADYKLAGGALHFNYNDNTVTRNYLEDSAGLISQGGSFSSNGYTGKAHYVELYGNFNLSNNIDLLAGADYRNQAVNETSLYIYNYGPTPPYSTGTSFSAINSDSARVRQFGAYASFLLKNLDGFNLELGGRYNSFNKYGNVFTYSINPSYVINDRFKLFANLSSGFSAPTLYQLYSPYKDPFGALKPEKTISTESGIQYSDNHFNARALYFLRSTTDNIIYDGSDPNYPFGYYINLDKQKDHGFELEANVSIKPFTFSGNYTYTTGQVTTKVGGKDSSFYNLYRIPKNTVNLSAGVQVTPALYLSLAYRTVDKRIESVYGGPPSTRDAFGYYTLDGYAEYKFGRQLKVFADLKNLTNQIYYDIPGFNSKKFNFMAGISVHF